MNTLDELAIAHETDKSSAHHNYAVKYDRLLSSKRESAARILEIGVLNGASLRMWRSYFTNAHIYALGINPDCCKQTDDRITVLIGDQGNVCDLHELAKHGPFDLIVDDGSHRYEHQIASFRELWDSVAKTGLYIVEDIATSYWRGWGDGMTALNYFKQIVDCVNFRGAMTPDLSRRERAIIPLLFGKVDYPLNIQSVTFYNGFVALEKTAG